jgi:hypothetical protein
MRWTDFFSHLEHDFALDAQPTGPELVGVDDADSYVLEVCWRAKAAGGQVTVGAVTGDVLHVTPRAVSTEWFSGLLGGERGSGVVIPLASVEWLESSGAASRRAQTTVVQATLVDVLADIRRRSAPVTIRTRHSDFAGNIVGVGKDYVDAVGHHTIHPTLIRRFPFPSIVAVFQGFASWG